MRFTTNIEWTKIRKFIIIVLISILLGHIAARLIIMNNERNQQEKTETETDKYYI
jgi:uncharacterized membrane-anchored protein YhcB (DUF1043 family)